METTPTGDKWLFTPGPLTTSPTVKAAMQHDLGSRDVEFIQKVDSIRRQLVEMVNAAPSDYTLIPIQGSGTYAVEATLSTVIPATGQLLLLENGAYGERMAQIARVHHIPCEVYSVPETEHHDPTEVRRRLQQNPALTHVALVHCETTSGILNPLAALAQVVKAENRTLIVDAMSTFGSYPMDVQALGVDFLCFSSNKCLEGSPGLGLVIARKNLLEACAGQARTLTLDLHAQWKGLDANGQFRYTPPTHVVLSLSQALAELAEEGGVAGRAARYRNNYEVLRKGMLALGFRELVPAERQAYIITTYFYPAHPNFRFDSFYQQLSELGFVIYPGKVSRAECFRLGNIGRMHEAQMHALLNAIQQVLAQLDIPTPLS